VDSRTIIRKVINQGGAPRIGYHLPPPWPNDIVHAGIAPAPGFDDRRTADGDSEAWYDEWGCLWRRLGGISKGEVFQGAIADWDQLDAYRPPDLGLESRYQDARRAFAAAPDKYRIGDIPGCAFNVSRYIRRLDNFLADCLLEPGRVRRLNAIVMDELLKAVRRMAEAGADAVMFPEDWGTQDRLLMSPATFRDLFLPEFHRLCGAAREAGLDVWMHSCGKMTEIIDDLIGAGVRVLQFDQPTLHGIDLLAARFAGRVAFECPVDIQRTLQSRDAGLIRQEARLLCEALGGRGAAAPRCARRVSAPAAHAQVAAYDRAAGTETRRAGGFIACRYTDEKAIGLEPEWQDIACEAFLEFGGWKG